MPSQIGNTELPQHDHSVEPRSDFDKQFGHKEIFDFSSGRVMVTDVIPNAPMSDGPLFVALGMGARTNFNEKAIETFYKCGRRTLAIDNDRKNGSADPGLTENSKFKPEAIRKAEALISTIVKKGFQKIDAVGHSEGAIVVAAAAVLRPDLFKNIVFLNPAGMVGKDSPLSLMIRQLLIENPHLAVRQKKDTAMADAKTKADSEFSNHMSDSGPNRLLQELDAVTGTELPQIISMLHEKGIHIAIVAGVDDNIFPMKKNYIS